MATDQIGGLLDTRRAYALGRIAVAVFGGTTHEKLTLVLTDNALTSRGLTIFYLANFLLVELIHWRICRASSGRGPPSSAIPKSLQFLKKPLAVTLPLRLLENVLKDLRAGSPRSSGRRGSPPTTSFANRRLRERTPWRMNLPGTE